MKKSFFSMAACLSIVVVVIAAFYNITYLKEEVDACKATIAKLETELETRKNNEQQLMSESVAQTEKLKSLHHTVNVFEEMRLAEKKFDKKDEKVSPEQLLDEQIRKLKDEFEELDKKMQKNKK